MRYLFRWAFVGGLVAGIAIVSGHLVRPSVYLGLAVCLVGTVAAWLYRRTYPSRYRRWRTRYDRRERQMYGQIVASTRRANGRPG